MTSPASKIVPHTPGPWHTNAIHASVRSADNDPVAVLMARTQEEDEANACLIAAAPRMAEFIMRLATQPEDDGLANMALAVLKETGVLP